MATVSNLLLAILPPPIKYVPFNPLILKRKIKSKRKAKAKPNIMEHSLYKDGSCGYSEEGVDVFSTDLLDSNALRSLDPGLPATVGATGPLGSLHLDGEGDLSTVPPL
jgi:hypothetical protein